MRRVSRAAALFALVGGAGVSLSGVARGSNRHYRNEALRIADFEVPRTGWTLAPASPYPGMLLVATSTDHDARRGAPSSDDEARLLLSGQKVLPGSGALPLAAEARARLLAAGYSDVRLQPLVPGPLGEDRVLLDGTAPGGRKTLRQAYVVETDVLVVLTAVAPLERRPRVLRDFDAALAGLVLARTAAEVAPVAPPDPVRPTPDGGSGGAPEGGR